VSGAPGPYEDEPATLEFQQTHSAIIHWTVRCATGLSGAPAEQQLTRATVDSAKATMRNYVRQKSEQKSEAHRTVNRTCPVPQEDNDANSRLFPNPNGWVTWRRTGHPIVPVRWRTGPHRQQPSPTAIWWLRAINTPQPPPQQAPKHSEHCRVIDSTPRHNQSNRSTQSPQFNSSALGLVRGSLVFLCCYCLLGLAFFLFSILTLKCFVSKARDTNCVVVLAGSK
jgi:hypothetical protein